MVVGCPVNITGAAEGFPTKSKVETNLPGGNPGKRDKATLEVTQKGKLLGNPEGVVAVLSINARVHK